MDNKKAEKKEGKALKVISIIFLSLAFLVLGVLIVADIFLDDFIKDTLTKEVREGTDRVYELEIGELDINVRTFRIEAENIHLATDEQRHAAQLDDPDPMPFIDLTANQLSISNINVWSFLFANRLQVGAIRIKNPVVDVRMYEQESDFYIEDVHKDLEEFAEALLINSIEVDSLYLDFALQNEGQWHEVSVANGGIDVDNLRIDSASTYSEDKILFTDRIKIGIKDTAVFNLIGLYRGSLGSLEWDSDDKLLVHNAVVHTDDSLYQRQAEFRRLSEPYVNLTLDTLELAFDEWGKLQQGGKELHVRHLVINNPDAYFIAPPMTQGKGGKESGYPQEKGFRMTFHEDLNDLYPSVTIDSVQMWNTHVHALLPEGPDTLDLEVPDLDFNLADIRLDSAGATDSERFMYASEASLLTRNGVTVRQGNKFAVGTDMVLVSTDSGVFVNNVHVSGSELPLSKASLASLNINFTEWGQLQQGDTVRVESIALHRPVLAGRFEAGSGNGNAQQRAERGFQLDIHQDVNDIVPLLNIGSVAISQANISAVLESEDAPMRIDVPHIDVLFSELRLDAYGANDPNRFMYARGGSVLARQGVAVNQGEDFALNTGLFVASTDSGVFARNIRFSGSASPDIEASLAKMDVHFTQWGNLQQGQNTRVESIALQSPVFRGQIELSQEGEGGQEEAQPITQRGIQLEVHKDLQEFVSLLTIGSVGISDADIQASIINGETVSEVGVPDLNLLASGIRLDSIGANDSNRFLYAREASIMTRNGVSFNQEGEFSVITGMMVMATDSGFFINDVHFEGSASPELTASLEALNMDFTQWGHLQQGEATHIKNIVLRRPNIEGFISGNNESQSNDESGGPLECEQELDFYVVPANLSEFVALLTIGSLQIDDGFLDVEMEVEEQEEPAKYMVGGLNLVMDNLKLDSAAADADDRFLFAEVFDLQMEKVEALPDHLYTIKLEDFNANSGQRNLSLRNFELIPNYPKVEFAEILGEESVRMDIEVPEIEVNGLRFGTLTDLEFTAGNIRVSGANIGLFLDRHLPPTGTEPPLYPHDQLTTLPVALNVDQVIVENSHLVYEELAEGGYESGEFIFEDFNATVYDLVNRPTEGYEKTVAQVRFDLMGTGDFVGQLTIPVLDPEKRFTFSGEMQPLNLERLNPALEYIAFVRIEEGQMHSLRFEMEGNRYHATGDLYASYEDLSIELLEEGPEEPGFPTTVISSIADRLLSTDNLEGTDDFTVGDMSAEREDDMEFTGLIVEALSRGMFDSFGVINLLDVVEEIQETLPFVGSAVENGENGMNIKKLKTKN